MGNENVKKKTIVTTSRAPKPGGAYSQAVRYGDLLFVSGIVSADVNAEEFTILHPGDIEKQTHLVLQHLKAIVDDAGSSLEQILKTTVFIDDIDKFSIFNDIYMQYFTEQLPARSTVEVSRFNRGICIEIEAIAAINE